MSPDVVFLLFPPKNNSFFCYVSKSQNTFTPPQMIEPKGQQKSQDNKKGPQKSNKDFWQTSCPVSTEFEIT